MFTPRTGIGLALHCSCEQIFTPPRERGAHRKGLCMLYNERRLPLVTVSTSSGSEASTDLEDYHSMADSVWPEHRLNRSTKDSEITW